MVTSALLALAVTLHVHGASYHYPRGLYNEANYGVGLRLNDWSGDVFRDSYGNPAATVGRVFEAKRGGLYWGVTAGYVYHTRYKGFAPVPQVRWEGAKMGVRAVFAANDDGGAIGVSLTVPLTR